MRYLIQFSYDGTNFAGYQAQPNTNLRTIQGTIEEVLTSINNHHRVKITATGRTDRGVHAMSQYAHLDMTVEITSSQLKRALNSYLPADIHVIRVEEAPSNFHVRYATIAKEYQYRINVGEYQPLRRHYVYQHNHPLAVEKMQKALAYLVGTHDFRAFVTENENQKNCVRTLFSAHLCFDPVFTEELVFTFRGDGFMRYQVRNMVGLLLKVGTGKIEPLLVKEILESKTRGKFGARAPSAGLCLVEVVLDRTKLFP